MLENENEHDTRGQHEHLLPEAGRGMAVWRLGDVDGGTQQDRSGAGPMRIHGSSIAA